MDYVQESLRDFDSSAAYRRILLADFVAIAPAQER